MDTKTTFFTENLIAGIQVSTILILFAAGLFGYSWLDINKFWLQLSIVFIALSYPLGIIFDRVYESFLKPIDRSIRMRYFKGEGKNDKSKEELDRARYNIIFSSEEMCAFMDYIRSKIRIARNSVFNFILLFIMADFFVSRQPEIEEKSGLFFFISAVGIVLATLSFNAFRDTSKIYYEKLRHFYDEFRKNNQTA